MAIHFPKDELAARRRAVTTEGMKRGIAGILISRQESMYYLTGYDTMGFCFFQCLYLGVNGRMTLLTRLPDLRQAQITSDIRDIRVWSDVAGANPAIDLRQVLVEHGCEGRKLGIEFDAYGLTAANWRTVEVELRGFCSLEDASDIVSGYRMVKSAMELDYVRRAAKLADAAFEEARQLAVPGAFEGDILAAMHAVIFKGDGDYPGNEFIIDSLVKTRFEEVPAL